jgi:hypothetical protein
VNNLGSGNSDFRYCRNTRPLCAIKTIMRKVLAIVTYLLLQGCHSEPKFKTMDAGFFSIQTPVEWRLANTKITNSVIGKTEFTTTRGSISVGQGDTAFFELGYFAGIPFEYISLALDKTDTLYYLTRDQKDAPETSKPTGDVPKGILPYLVSTQYSFLKIDGRNGALHKPVKAGIGITGIDIDSLKSRGVVNMNFILYGQNLKPPNESELLEAIKTIKFY